MTAELSLFHKHLHISYLIIFFVFYIILFLAEWRYAIIAKFTQLAKNLSTSKTFLILFFLFSFLIVSFFANSVLQRASDHIYIFQAETFLKGRLWNNPPAHYEFFTFHSLFIKDGKWLSRVFPGWPFLLSIPMFFHVPSWLLNPALGTASLIVLFFLAKLLFNDTIALLTVTTVLLSPFYLFNAASYVPHISCGLFILLAVYFNCIYYIQKKPPTYICWIGVCIGAAYLIRPFSTLCCLGPIFISSIMRRKGEFFKKDLWYFMLGMAPFLLINFAYNYFITGNFLLSPFNWSDPTDTAHIKLSIILNNIDSMENQLLWMNPTIFFMYLFMIVFLSIKKKIQSHEFLFFILIFGCFFYGAPGVSYGARYYFEGYLLCVLTVIGRFSEFKKGNIKQHLTLALLAGFFTILLTSFAFIIHFRHKMTCETEVFRLAREKHLSNAVIFMSHGEDNTPNDPDFQNKVLYAHDLKEKNMILMQYFPTRNFYIYNPWAKNEWQRIQKYNLVKNP